MRRCVAGLILLLGMAALAHAQTAPFDMSPERGGSQPAAPGPAMPSVQPSPPPTQQSSPAGPAPRDAGPSRQTEGPGASAARRFIVPGRQLVLGGETDRRSWTVNLTPEQAETGAKLHLGYQNSIVVAPELSSLTVTINDRQVIEQPISSANGVTGLQAAIPPGLLRSGPNLITIGTAMRHRTDCTISSTYELWTEIDRSRSFLAFPSGDVARLRRVDDIAAIGSDEKGVTQFTIVAPAADLALSTGPIIRLAEGLARMANMPNQSVTIVSKPGQASGPGRLTIAVGTPAELSSVMQDPPAGASVSSVAAFVDDARLGQSALVLSGPTWDVISAAIETIVKPVDRPTGTTRTTLTTSAWRAPDTRLFTAAGKATLGELGALTQEFSGRRFRTDFAVGIPSDFYANAYGEATILLDAAYSRDVLPGSHIDVYVNGNIASTLPITQAGGGIFRHFPVNVTLRHFRPGANVIALEAVLLTSADAICAPGATGLDAPRFALFDTSEFRMPDFARIGRRPDLAGISGTGFPYSRSPTPVPLLLERGSLPALSAAATLLARMSVVAGRLIPVDLTHTPAAAIDRDAIFVGTIDSLQPQLLGDLGLAPEARTVWGNAPTGIDPASDKAETRQVFDRWREQLSDGGWRGRISVFEDWLSRNFDITPDALQLTPRKNPAFMPGNDIRLVMAQELSPTGNGTWTTLTAPTDEALADGMAALAASDAWSLISGQVTTYREAEPRIGNVGVGQFQFVETQPATLANYRLIVANWLSANALSYAAALIIFCIFLGVATEALLSVLGRRS